MATPHACWVILVGNVPTSFRAKTREELVPTFKQLQRTQPAVALRWFERGKVFESPDAARAAVKLAATERRERRGKDWRPGGDHKDPKARFELTRDQKRAKFKRNLVTKSRTAGQESAAPTKRQRPKGDPFAD